MASTKLLVFLCGLVLCSAQQGQQQKPECADEVTAFHECMASNSQRPPNPDFQAIKKASDDCFAKSGCKAPSQDQRFDGQHGPGGRAGPPPGGNSGNSNNGDFTCFKNVHEKVGDEFVSCMKQKDPSFDKNGPQSGGPPHGGPGGPGGFPPHGGPGGFPPPGGPGGFGPPPFGPPPGGPGGFGPPPGGPPPGGPHGGPGGPADGPPVDFLAMLCNNDNDKAKELQTCLKGVFESNKPTRDQVKTQYDSMCKAEATCKPKLGQCEAIMHKKGKEACECHEQAKTKAEEVMKSEPTCANIQKPPFPGPPNGEKHDCSKPPPSPCEEGFDKFYERVSNFPPPPPPQPPPQ